MDGRRAEGVVAGSEEGEGTAPPPPPLAAPLIGSAGGAEAGAAAAEANGPDPGAAPPGPGHGGGRTHTSWLSLDANGFREAVTILEDVNDRRPIDVLFVKTEDVESPGEVDAGEAEPGEDEIGDERDVAPSFSRFASLLGQREGGRAVRNIFFRMECWRGLPEEDVGRLFRDVLPGHRTLESIDIRIEQFPPTLLQMLTESLPTTRLTLLSKLSIRGFGRIDPTAKEQMAQSIVDMMLRNVAIEDLSVRVDLDSGQCKLICQALHRNTNLRSLDLRVEEVSTGALDGVAASSLRRLEVSGSFSEGAVSSLTRQLRTNETLREMRLEGSSGIHDSQALLDLVKTYNYAILGIWGRLGSDHVDARVQEQLEKYMKRNNRIRFTLVRLQNTHDPQELLDIWKDFGSRGMYQFRDIQEPPDSDRPESLPTNLLPPLLGLVSDVPTALYRVLKMGYVNDVSKAIGWAYGGRRNRVVAVASIEIRAS